MKQLLKKMKSGIGQIGALKAEPGKNLLSADAGKHQVENDERRRILLRQTQAGRTVGGRA